MHYLATLLLASILVPPLVSSSSWNDPNSKQYHIQTDEGPERYFRYQTDNGQYRKEKRLQDGTVIGTYAWIDDDGYLRQRDYIADNQGYRIVKNKNIFVGRNVNVGEAVKAAKRVSNIHRSPVKVNAFSQVPNTGYVSITPKPIYTITGVTPSVELSQNSIPSSTTAPILLVSSSLSPPSVSNSNDFVRNYVTSNIKAQISNNLVKYSPSPPTAPITSTYSSNEIYPTGYISSSTLRPPTETYLPSSEDRSSYISSKNPLNVIYSSTNNPNNIEIFPTSTVSPLPSVSDVPPVSSTTYLPPSSSYPHYSIQKVYTPSSNYPSPIYISTARPIVSSPRPFKQSSQPSSIYLPSQASNYFSGFINNESSTAIGHTSSTQDFSHVTSLLKEYNSQPQGFKSNSIDYSARTDYEDYPENFVNPYIHQNGPTYPIDSKGHSFNPSYNNIGNGYDPQYPYYDGISVTNDGFRYYIPRAYHEEQNSANDRKSGSFGYVDPFGIRRVIYYNAGPDGFKHRKNNRYVGLNGTPYDPRPY